MEKCYDKFIGIYNEHIHQTDPKKNYDSVLMLRNHYMYDTSLGKSLTNGKKEL